jgi:hypothetical protein
LAITTQIRYAKTWQHSVNDECYFQTTNAAFFQNIVRKIVTKLLGFATSAWTAWKASDSVAVVSGSSNWDADTDLVWGATNGVNAHSWIVLAQAGLGGAQLLISLLGASSGSTVGKVAISPGGLYGLNGQPTGTTTTDPGADDEIVLIAAGGQLLALVENVFDHGDGLARDVAPGRGVHDLDLERGVVR